jgi:hypothetical protein
MQSPTVRYPVFGHNVRKQRISTHAIDRARLAMIKTRFPIAVLAMSVALQMTTISAFSVVPAVVALRIPFAISGPAFLGVEKPIHDSGGLSNSVEATLDSSLAEFNANCQFFISEERRDHYYPYLSNCGK